MPGLSVVTMTLNEERNLDRCLRSVREIADEIVVVDSFSTDRTEEISLSYGARFIRHPFGGYVEQRRFSISQATHDHVLVIDADEAVSDELREAIRGIKENWTHDSYEMNRLNSYCGQWIRHSGWYPDRKLRLFDRRKITVSGRNPHDKIVAVEKATTKHLKGDLLHFTYYTVEEHIRQINRFTEIDARDKYEKGVKAGWFSMLAGPAFMFIRNYIFSLGFLDGYYGFLICHNTAYYTFLKHAKLRAMWKMKNGTGS